ncbi:uncharacterized protein LOC106151235 isoform X1 [Lingula anatina]|uniref:Uncharacterized protein LOC106151235 isoform X1 n=1 Tax=Lingula anatina TaxID=7574 RepID=A0A1S3H2W8_LINAN|nr:uncharacterized protein LOC106151235 isoform X1 [Lingula anatina]|eukprot:XP_013379826.1 uncharacterized protein LOC106151235 isoform X1 [Lingula anatina]
MFCRVGQSVGLIFLGIFVSQCRCQHLDFGKGPQKLAWLQFLVVVNDTWDPDGCIATVKTPQIIPGSKHAPNIMVGSCDQGGLELSVSQLNATTVNVHLLFHSSVIEDASPPTCDIPWKGGYLTPTTTSAKESLLPGCFTAESREGYHMTYYWFYIIDWMWGA